MSITETERNDISSQISIAETENNDISSQCSTNDNDYIVTVMLLSFI